MLKVQDIPTGQLYIDEDVQLAFALSEKKWKTLASRWDEEKAGVLEVIASPRGFAIIEGRHRYLAGKSRSVRVWRCIVHDIDVDDRERKAALKLGFDRDRRNVSALEHFLIRVMAGDPVTTEMRELAEAVGFEIAKRSAKSQGSRTLECVGALENFYKTLGSAKFLRMLSLAALWIEDPAAYKADWLGGVGAFVRDDYDLRGGNWRDTIAVRVSPPVAVRHARSEIVKRGIGGVSTSGGGFKGFAGLHVVVADYMRAKARIKRRTA